MIFIYVHCLICTSACCIIWVCILWHGGSFHSIAFSSYVFVVTFTFHAHLHPPLCCGIAHTICHHTCIMCSVLYINISRHTYSLSCYCLHQIITVLHRLLFAPKGELICEPRYNSFHMQCPHCQRDESVSEAVENPKFCLEEIGGSYQLKKSHAYYYQVLAWCIVIQFVVYVMSFLN